MWKDFQVFVFRVEKSIVLIDDTFGFYQSQTHKTVHPLDASK